LRVDAQQVTIIPRCVECEAHWLPADEERWRAYHTDDEPPELAFFCPECVERGKGVHELGVWSTALAKGTPMVPKQPRRRRKWPRLSVDTED
jgi:hypothetical protein